jgi:homoserine dehydrogenase
MREPIDAVGVGLLGFGTVGAEVYRLLRDHGDLVQQRVGIPITVQKVAVADRRKPRAQPIPPHLLATDAWEVVTDPTVHVVVEVMGGVEGARLFVLRALDLGKPVVTANKQLLSHFGGDLLARARASNADLFFEGTVGSCIPLIKTLRESLAADRIRGVEGILNGTTNYILTRMSEEAWTFEQALAAARARGFAEADPTEDIEGHDAAAKLAILASLAFDCQITADRVYREGIGSITPREIAYARELGYAVKLLALGEDRDGAIDVRVHPALLPLAHPLAAISDERNAVLVKGEAAGSVVFSGPGAGGPPTAVAVVSDIIDAARNLRRCGGARILLPSFASRPIHPISDLTIPYFFAMQVTDRPGVFAKVAAVFGEESVSIASIVQKSRGAVADVVLLTHEAQEAAVRRVTNRLRTMEVVGGVDSVIRVVE